MKGMRLGDGNKGAAGLVVCRTQSPRDLLLNHIPGFGKTLARGSVVPGYSGARQQVLIHLQKFRKRLLRLRHAPQSFHRQWLGALVKLTDVMRARVESARRADISSRVSGLSMARNS